MRTAAVLRLLLLLACSSLASTAKTCAVKWAQTLDGTVVAVVQIKRSGKLCEGESATVVDQTLHYRMTCSGDEFGIDVLLQHPVDEARVSVKREPGSLVAITLHKASAAVWWSSLAKHPDKFKTLISRDFGRGDAEPDPEELEELASAAVDAASGSATQRPSGKEAAAAARAEADKAHMQEDWQDALQKAQEEMTSGKVSPQLVARLKTLKEVLPEQAIHSASLRRANRPSARASRGLRARATA